jgi:hypothetical protein
METTRRDFIKLLPTSIVMIPIITKNISLCEHEFSFDTMACKKCGITEERLYN